MASLSYDRTKQRWRIQFVAPDGARKSLGMRGSEKAKARAQTYKSRVEELLSATLTGTAPAQSLAVWVVSLPDGLTASYRRQDWYRRGNRSSWGAFLIHG